MPAAKTALVLGASGGIGSAITQSLIRYGWTVRAMVRNPVKAAMEWESGPAPAWVTGDAMSADDVVDAAIGTSAIVHAVNPPGYRNWDKLVLPMMANTIAAARAAGGARVVLPGTIYGYDPATTLVIDETTPQAPRTRKGKIRVELEEMLERAAPAVPSLILRAGDFFGPEARSSWFSQAMIRKGRPVDRLLTLTGTPGHSWAYLPDLAEAFARLMERMDLLQPFERLQFAGYCDRTGDDLGSAVRRVLRRDVPVRAFPWWLMRLLSPFGGFPRQVVEIEPYWHHPVLFDNGRLLDLIGVEPRTPLDVAVGRTLAALGCLDPASTEPATRK